MGGTAGLAGGGGRLTAEPAEKPLVKMGITVVN